MAWKAIDRRTPVAESEQIELHEQVAAKIRELLPRYPVKRAALLPALHIVQDSYGFVPPSTVAQIAAILDIKPADVLDTLSFYTHFWTQPKGREVITICRSITCQLMGSDKLTDAVREHLHCGDGGTSADGRYSILIEECIAACEKGPCMIVGERLYGPVKPEQVPGILDNPDAGKIPYERVGTMLRPEGFEYVHPDPRMPTGPAGQPSEPQQPGGETNRADSNEPTPQSV